jgi:hypothetical protein
VLVFDDKQRVLRDGKLVAIIAKDFVQATALLSEAEIAKIKRETGVSRVRKPILLPGEELV